MAKRAADRAPATRNATAPARLPQEEHRGSAADGQFEAASETLWAA
jgi:hypothetical protein